MILSTSIEQEREGKRPKMKTREGEKRERQNEKR